MMRTISFARPVILAGGVFLLGACSTAGDPLDVPATVVRTGTLEVVVEELGVVESTRVANIKAPHRARIVMLADDGVAVRKGDPVVILDTEELVRTMEERLEDLQGVKKEMEQAIEDLMIALRNSTLDISSAEAQLDLARVQLAEVNKELAELELLFTEELVAEDQVRTAESSVLRTQINTLGQDMDFRSQITGAQSSQQSRTVRLERLGLDGRERGDRIVELNERIQAATITAPVDGMFLRQKRFNWRERKNVEWRVGEEVREGALLGTVPDLTTMVVRTQVPERFLADVAVGNPVTLSFEALNDLRVEGRVVSIAPVAIERESSPGGQLQAAGEQLSGEKVFEVGVAMNALDPRIRPGNTARARIVLDRRDGLLTLPINTIATLGTRHLVMVEVGEGRNVRWETREIRLGQANNLIVEVLDGLKEGERVRLAPPGAEVSAQQGAGGAGVSG